MKTLTIPPDILNAILQGAALALCVSGGKDGQVMAKAVCTFMREAGFTNKMFLVHADLGKMEWPESLPQCERLAQELTLPLFVVRASEGGLLARLRRRLNKMPQNQAGAPAPFWPSPASRYCTSDEKRGPIDKLLRQYALVICVEGIRAQESANRAKKPTCCLRKQITSTAYNGSVQDVIEGKRLAITWNAIIEWSIDDVWEAYEHSAAELRRRQQLYAGGEKEKALEGWQFSPVYVYGNERVSCRYCIPYGSPNDMRNAGEHDTDGLGEELAEMEKLSGFTFRKGQSIRQYLVKPKT